MRVRPGPAIQERQVRRFRQVRRSACFFCWEAMTKKPARLRNRRGRPTPPRACVSFPVVTTHQVEGRRIAKVLGLVCCRGYDSEEAFFGMAGRAMNKGAQAIVGYNENVAFHPDGSKYFSCFGTAVMFEYDPADPDSLPLMLQQKFREREQQPNSDMI